MIRCLVALALVILLPVAQAAAQDHVDTLDLGGDVFRAGTSATVDAPGAADVFLAGERVDLAQAISGAAHLAGRRVSVDGDVGGDLYAFGADVSVAAPVAGAATVMGYDVTLGAPVAGNLRAAGSRVDIAAAVGGAALIAGNTVLLAAPISGDAVITADDLSFGEGARVDGTLTLYEDEGAATAVPASVAPPERIERRQFEDAPMMSGIGGPTWLAVLIGLVLSALVLAILTVIVAAVAPRSMSRLGAIVADGPFRALGAGFLTQATLIGGAVLFALTVIGLILAPFVLLAAVVLGVIGYLVAVYLLGVWTITRAGALEPDTFPEYALAAVVGAVIASLLTLVPFVGWLILIALTLIGIGAISIATFGRNHAFER